HTRRPAHATQLTRAHRLHRGSPHRTHRVTSRPQRLARTRPPREKSSAWRNAALRRSTGRRPTPSRHDPLHRRLRRTHTPFRSHTRLLLHRRAHRTHAAAALHPPRQTPVRHARRSRALPDHLLAAVRLCRRSYRRPALHPGDPLRAHRPRHRACVHHTACRPRHVPASTRRGHTRHPPAFRALHTLNRNCARPQQCPSRQSPHHCRRNHHHAHARAPRPHLRVHTRPTLARESTRAPAALRQHQPLPLAPARWRRQLQARPRSPHQLPPARVHAAHAGQRLRGNGSCAPRLRARSRRALPLLQ